MKETSNRERDDGSGTQPDERASLEALVEKVVGAAYELSNVLGAGFLEKIYERALVEELNARGMRVKAQAPLPVVYNLNYAHNWRPERWSGSADGACG